MTAINEYSYLLWLLLPLLLLGWWLVLFKGFQPRIPFLTKKFAGVRKVDRSKKRTAVRSKTNGHFRRVTASPTARSNEIAAQSSETTQTRAKAEARPVSASSSAELHAAKRKIAKLIEQLDETRLRLFATEKKLGHAQSVLKSTEQQLRNASDAKSKLKRQLKEVVSNQQQKNAQAVDHGLAVQENRNLKNKIQELQSQLELGQKQQNTQTAEISRLQTELSESQTLITDLHSRMNELGDSELKLNAKLLELQQQQAEDERQWNLNKEEASRTTQRRLDELEHRLAESESSRSSFDQQNHQLRERVGTLETQLQDARASVSQFSDLSREYQSGQKALADTKKQLELGRQQQEVQAAEMKRLQSELSESESIISDLQSEINELDETRSKLNADLEELQHQAEQRHEWESKHEQKFHESQCQLEKLKCQLAETENAQFSLDQHNQKLCEQIEALRAQLQEAQTSAEQFFDLSRDHELAQKALADTKEQIALGEQHQAAQRSEIDQLRSELGESEAVVADLHSQIHGLAAAEIKLNAELRELRQEKVENERQWKLKEKQASQYTRRRLQELEAQFAEAEKSRISAQQQNQNLQEQVGELNTRLQGAEASVSQVAALTRDYQLSQEALVDVKKRLELGEQQRAAQVSEIDRLESKLAESEVMIADLHSQIKDSGVSEHNLNAKLQELHQQQAQIEHEWKLKEERALQHSQHRLEELERQLAESEAGRISFEQHNQELQVEVGVLNNRLQDSAVQVLQVDVLSRDYQLSQRELIDTRKQLELAEQERIAQTAEIDRLQSELVESKEMMIDLEQDRDELKCRLKDVVEQKRQSDSLLQDLKTVKMATKAASDSAEEMKANGPIQTYTFVGKPNVVDTSGNEGYEVASKLPVEVALEHQRRMNELEDSLKQARKNVRRDVEHIDLAFESFTDELGMP